MTATTSTAPPPQPVDQTQAVNGAAGTPAFAVQQAFGGIPMTSDEIKDVKADFFASQKQLRDLADREERALESAQAPTPPPAPQSGLLDRLAPLLLISAFSGPGGKAAAGDALAATVGATRGFIAGDQANFQQQQDRYQQALAAMKAHQDEVDKIYQTMREAYKDRIDGDLKALQFARQVTGDQVKLTGQAVDMHDRVNVAMDKLHEDWQKHLDEDALKKARDAAKNAPTDTDPASIKLKADLFMKDPTNTRFTAAERKQITTYLASKGVTADDIVNGRAQTKVAYAEARSLGNQKAQLERVEKALTDPGGIADQAEQAAAKLSTASLKQYNRVSQLFGAQTSDPALASYRIKMLALRDEYATVINKGGAPTDASRAQATEAMDGYQVTAVPAIVQAIKETAASNRKALQESIEDSGRTDTPADVRMAQPPAAPPPTIPSAPNTTSWANLPE